MNKQISSWLKKWWTSVYKYSFVITWRHNIQIYNDVCLRACVYVRLENRIQFVFCLKVNDKLLCSSILLTGKHIVTHISFLAWLHPHIRSCKFSINRPKMGSDKRKRQHSIAENVLQKNKFKFDKRTVWCFREMLTKLKIKLKLIEFWVSIGIKCAMRSELNTEIIWVTRDK